MLPDAFWSDERRRLLALLGPAIEGAAMDGAAAAARRLGGIGLDYETVNQSAADWARQYTDELLGQLGATSEKLVGDALAAWIEQPGATMGDLVGLLTPRFAGNQARADLIAVTEITRAYANGQKAAFQAAGVTRWRWNTNRDELVCPVCAPLNGQVVEIGQPFGEFRGKTFSEPPSHPGCRCWVSPVNRRENRAKAEAIDFSSPNSQPVGYIDYLQTLYPDEAGGSFSAAPMQVLVDDRQKRHIRRDHHGEYAWFAQARDIIETAIANPKIVSDSLRDVKNDYRSFSIVAETGLEEKPYLILVIRAAKPGEEAHMLYTAFLAEKRYVFLADGRLKPRFMYTKK